MDRNYILNGAEIGYVTRYELDIYDNNGKPVNQHIIRDIGSMKNIEDECLDYAEMVDIFNELKSDDNLYGIASEERCKWYEHTDEMKKFSRKHPDFVFALHGEGEETDDIWTKYFHNGKLQVCIPQLVWPDFDIKEFIERENNERTSV